MPTPAELAADAESTIADAAQAPGLAALVEQLVELKASLDAIEEHRKEIQEQYDELRKRYIPEKLNELGLTGAKLPQGTLSMRHTMRASVPKERRGECREWCLTHGHEDLLTVHSSTILGLANELVEQGASVPEFISTYVEEVAVLTRSRGATKE